MNSQTSSPDLSPLQAEVLFALASGSTVSSAAESAGCSRTTVHSWLSQPDFAQELENAKADFIQALREDIVKAKLEALHTLSSLMKDTSAPPSVRLKAALAVLNRPLAELESLISTPDLAPTTETSAPENQATQPALNTSEQKNVNSPAQQPVRVDKVGRNELCPCGSGRKFKHCCLRKPASAGNDSTAPAGPDTDAVRSEEGRPAAA